MRTYYVVCRKPSVGTTGVVSRVELLRVLRLVPSPVAALVELIPREHGPWILNLYARATNPVRDAIDVVPRVDLGQRPWPAGAVVNRKELNVDEAQGGVSPYCCVGKPLQPLSLRLAQLVQRPHPAPLLDGKVPGELAEAWCQKLLLISGIAARGPGRECQLLEALEPRQVKAAEPFDFEVAYAERAQRARLGRDRGSDHRQAEGGLGLVDEMISKRKMVEACWPSEKAPKVIGWPTEHVYINAAYCPMRGLLDSLGLAAVGSTKMKGFAYRWGFFLRPSTSEIVAGKVSEVGNASQRLTYVCQRRAPLAP